MEVLVRQGLKPVAYFPLLGATGTRVSLGARPEASATTTQGDHLPSGLVRKLLKALRPLDASPAVEPFGESQTLPPRVLTGFFQVQNCSQ